MIVVHGRFGLCFSAGGGSGKPAGIVPLDTRQVAADRCCRGSPVKRPVPIRLPQGEQLWGRWEQTRVSPTSSAELRYAITSEQGTDRFGDPLGAFVRDGAGSWRQGRA